MWLSKGIKVISLVLVLGAIVTVDLMETAIAQPTQETLIARSSRRRLNFRVGVRPSRSRVGGFSRSPKSCDNQTQITAFAPPPRADEKIDEKHGAVDATLSSHPTFWVHLAGVPQDTPIQFTLQDEAIGKKDLYITKFQSNGKTGILGVRLPSTAPDLKVGKRYVWQMAIRCEPTDRSADRVLGGWVERLDPTQIKPTQGFNPKPLVQELARASEQDQPALYAGLGVWQDAVTTLVNLQLKQPQNRELKDDWRTLLTEAQMKEFIHAPLLGVK
ncbi:MAG: DUF928 domain-containing protein [Stenomitos frigidus ULC029]